MKPVKKSVNFTYVQIRDINGKQKKVAIERTLKKLFGIPMPQRKRNGSRKQIMIDGTMYAFPISILKRYQTNPSPDEK